MPFQRLAFANAYSADKTISTFFGRPPRLLIRYCTCRPPYDLSDEEVIAPAHSRDLAIARLDREGWSSCGILQRPTFARIKFVLNIVLEEVLDLSLVPPTSDMEQCQKAQYVRDLFWRQSAERFSESSSTRQMQLGNLFQASPNMTRVVGILISPPTIVIPCCHLCFT